MTARHAMIEDLNVLIVRHHQLYPAAGREQVEALIFAAATVYAGVNRLGVESFEGIGAALLGVLAQYERRN